MMATRRKLLVTVLTIGFSLVVTVGSVLAAELLATIKSVDVEKKQITVTPKEGGDDVVVTIDEKTEFHTAKGKKIENYDLAKAKKGFELEIVHEKGLASKITIKKGAGKKKQQQND